MKADPERRNGNELQCKLNERRCLGKYAMLAKGPRRRAKLSQVLMETYYTIHNCNANHICTLICDAPISGGRITK